MNSRKNRVIEIALKLFIEKGFQETSLQDILDSAGISKGTFYNYFSSKNECLCAILEQTRNDNISRRNELLVGEDPSDIDILIKQITLVLNNYEERNLDSLLESVQYANDQEVKKMLLHRRLTELQWLAERLTDVFGDEVRPYSIECAIVFYGIIKEIFTVWGMIHTINLDSTQVVITALKHISRIAPSLVEEKNVIFNIENIIAIKNALGNSIVSKEYLIDKLRKLQEKMLHEHVSKRCIDLTNTLFEAVSAKDLRESVVEIVLGPFYKAYKETKLQYEAEEIASITWNYLKNQS